MFANAGVENEVKRSKHSPDNVSFEVDNNGKNIIPGFDMATNSIAVIEHEMSMDDDSYQVYEASSPENVMPVTPESGNDTVTRHYLDDAGFTTHAFYQAGIAITSEGISMLLNQSTLPSDPEAELADNYRAMAGPNATGHHVVNEADQVEKSAASTGFYGGFDVEESPSPYHAPVIDQASGFGDVREGAEEFPKYWQDNEPRLKIYTLEEADAMMGEYSIGEYSMAMDTDPFSPGPVLMPSMAMDTDPFSPGPVLMPSMAMETDPYSPGPGFKPTSRVKATAKEQHGRGSSPVVIDLTADDSSQDESNGTG